jgi:hypothetical protein
MSINLRIGLIIVSIILLLIIFVILKKKRMPVKYSLIWILSALIILFIGIFPGIFTWFSKFFGFVTMSNMVIAIFIFILLMITIMLTIIVSSQNKKIILLTQEISMIKSKVSQK